MLAVDGRTRLLVALTGVLVLPMLFLKDVMARALHSL